MMGGTDPQSFALLLVHDCMRRDADGAWGVLTRVRLARQLSQTPLALCRRYCTRRYLGLTGIKIELALVLSNLVR